MKIYKITYPDVENFIGCRITIWLTGCNHHCLGCHNADLWNINVGREFTGNDKQRVIEILSKPYIKGITFSGGDPIMQANDVANFIKELKADDLTKYKDICLYTGYTMKELVELSRNDSGIGEVLCLCDYIVDGKYDQTKRDVTLAFRGSSNQIIWEKYNGNEWRVSSKYNDVNIEEQERYLIYRGNITKAEKLPNPMGENFYFDIIK